MRAYKDSSEAFGALRVLRDCPIVFMFPGGGAQHPGAARGLYEQADIFRETVEECFRLMPRSVPGDLRSLMFESDLGDANAAAALQRPLRGLVALFVIECALARLWESHGVKPSAVIGHSAGEYAAAVSAGVMALPDALELVALRGEICEGAAPGAMLAVWLSQEELRARLDSGLEIAAVNAPDLCVATGERAAIQSLHDRLRREGIEVSRVRIDVAAHSSLLDPHLERYRRKVDAIPLAAPRLRFLSTLTGAPADGAELTRSEYWVRQLRRTVRFAEALRSRHEEGAAIFLEVGPGRSLSGLARNLCGGSPVIASLPRPDDSESDLECMQRARAQLSGMAKERPPAEAPVYADDLEARIAGMWGGLLRAESVRPEDRFFAMGGDSLAAVSLFAWIRSEFGIDLPLATLYEAQTLRDIASRVRARAPPPPWSPMVLIQRGAASRMPLICVHGGGGNVLVFNALTRNLGEVQPVYGLQARGIDGRERPHESVEAMAECYLSAIGEILPEGPFCLAGYSGGGVIAFEMTRRLLERGASMPLLIMFDTLSPTLAHRSLPARILGLPHWTFQLMQEFSERLKKRRRTAEQSARIRRHLAAGEVIPEELRDLHLWQSYVRAQARYRPAPLDARLLLFRAKRQRIGAVGRCLGWNRLIGAPIEVHEIDCHHHNIMSAEPVERMCRVLRRRLDELNGMPEETPGAPAATEVRRDLFLAGAGAGS